MRRHTLRSAALAGTLVLSGSISGSAPALASCLPLGTMLPDPSTPGAVVFLGTVTGADALDTQLVVEAWYLGDSPTDLIGVTGGREVGTITSADWRPHAGERFVVVGYRDVDGSVSTSTCQQSPVDPSLLDSLRADYGEPQLPPFDLVPAASPAIVTMSPFPAPLVEGSPTP